MVKPVGAGLMWTARGGGDDDGKHVPVVRSVKMKTNTSQGSKIAFVSFIIIATHHLCDHDDNNNKKRGFQPKRRNVTNMQ